MIAYPDTSFLWAFYVRQSNSPEAATHASTMTEPLYLSKLLAYEFRQSLRFHIWRNAFNPREGITPVAAQTALNQLQMDLKGGVAEIAHCSFHDVFERAGILSEQYTCGRGHRSFDILHVATALVLEAEQLLTFDRNQRKLAEAVGLQIAPRME